MQVYLGARFRITGNQTFPGNPEKFHGRGSKHNGWCIKQGPEYSLAIEDKKRYEVH